MCQGSKRIVPAFAVYVRMSATACLRDREFAGPDALRQALGELGHRLLAIAGDHVGEGREDRRGRDAVGIEPVMDGFLPGIDDIAQRGALGLVRILEGCRRFDEFFHACPSNGMTPSHRRFETRI